MIQVVGTTYHLTQFERRSRDVQVADTLETASKKAVFSFCAEPALVVLVAPEKHLKSLKERFSCEVIAIARERQEPYSFNLQHVLVSHLWKGDT